MMHKYSIFIAVSFGLWACQEPQTSHSTIFGSSENSELAEAAEAALKKNCASCHGSSSSGEGGINYMTNLESLVANGKVKRGSVADRKKSRILVRLKNQDDPMPPLEDMNGRNLKRPSAKDIAAIENWIMADSPLSDDSVNAANFISRDDIEKAILADLKKQKAKTNFRYLTLEHLYNAGLSEAELTSARLNISRIINSLSWEKKIVVPEAFGPNKTILRLDLRDYGWDDQRWAEVEGVYPYIHSKKSSTFEEIAELAFAYEPILRGDFFAHVTSRPPLYYEMLRPSANAEFPANILELEELLEVDVEKELNSTVRNEEPYVIRLGIPSNESGISQHNRMLERFDTEYGAYWKSYDFADGDGPEKDLNDCPLGPSEYDPTEFHSCTGRSFAHDGGEMIWHLPNGLQAYLVVNEEGERINEAPTEIVFDQSSLVRYVAGSTQGAVVPGISCMACHTEGMRLATDKVRSSALGQGSRFRENVQDIISKLYPTKDVADKFFSQDNKVFANALVKTGSSESSGESFVGIVARYAGVVDLKSAASEFSMTPQEFQKLARKMPRQLQVKLANILNNGSITRKRFEILYPEVLSEITGEEEGGGIPDSQEPEDPEADEDFEEEESSREDFSCKTKYTSFRFIPTGAVQDNQITIRNMQFRIGNDIYYAEDYDDSPYDDDSAPRTLVIVSDTDDKKYIIKTEISSDTARRVLPMHRAHYWVPEKFKRRNGKVIESEYFAFEFTERVLLTGISFEHDYRPITGFRIEASSGARKEKIIAKHKSKKGEDISKVKLNGCKKKPK